MRRKLIGLFAVLALTLLPMSNVSAASGGGMVRIPHSAAEWDRFSPNEKALATAWAIHQGQSASVTSALNAQVNSQIASSKTANASLLAATGNIDCGIAVNNQPWGSYTYGWAQVWVTVSMNIDTGVTNRNAGYWDTFYRNGKYVQSFGAASGGTSAYAQSIQDFKWAWETLTYSIQAYGTARQSNGTYLFYLRPCFKAMGV